jgi:hypothetical protein
MDTFVVAIVLVIVILVPLIGLAWYQRRSGRGKPVAGTPAPSAPIGWGEIRIGDRIVWADRDDGVRGIVDCVEERGDRLFGWRWILLDDGGLLEYRANRLKLFGPSILLDPETEDYDVLTSPRGALARFESGSRLSWDPVTFEWSGRAYEVTGTGTFEARTEDDLSDEPVWQAISADRKDNIFFALEVTAEEEAAGEAEGVLLGIWTDRVALYPCLKLGSTGDARIRRIDPDLGGRSP